MTDTMPSDPEPRRRQISGAKPAGPRYLLADVLTLIPKTKRSQVELLVRSGRIVPAWPSGGTGHDRAFDGRNLFEIAVATELMGLGFTGDRLTKHFRQIMGIILAPDNAPDAEYLVLMPTEGWALPVPNLLPAAELESTVGLFPSVYVLSIRRILGGLHVALDDFRKHKDAE